MKVKTETALFEVPFGSFLYGTQNENSDLDFKVVCLPSHDTLLLNYKVTNRKVIPEGKKDGEKMSAGEAEYEYIPLQIFLDDFFNGQTYALEIAFAVLQDRMVYKGMDLNEAVKNDDYFTDISFIYTWIDDLVCAFLTKNVSKMVGYAVSQSKTYGLKTERFTALKTAKEIIEKHCAALSAVDLVKIKPMDTPELVEELCKLDHVKRTQILNGAGGTKLSPALEICGKQFSFTNTWSTIYKSLSNTLAGYGDRVKKFDGEGVDWKALSHAIRITEQVIELSTKGNFTFPRPNAEYLKQVKEGKITIEEATQYLTDQFNKVDQAIENSVLKERTPELEKEFEQFKIHLLTAYYDL